MIPFRFFSPYVPCDKCEGTGYRPLFFFRSYYRPCTRCNGTGLRLRPAARIWAMLRHGSAIGEDY